MITIVRFFFSLLLLLPPLPAGGPADARPNTGRELQMRIAVLRDVYGERIEDVIWAGTNPVLIVRGDTIHVAGGRLVHASRLPELSRYGTQWDLYPRGILAGVRPYREKTLLAPDLWDSLFGDSEKEVRKQCREGRFLDHFIFMNSVCHEPLAAVERDIREAALEDEAVRRFLSELDIVYSFQRRNTKGFDGNVSLHSFGLALDLVPCLYHGKQVFWRWSRVFYPETWYRIPLERRWAPPQPVIDAFEMHGFVWGGKWVHFDTIHFEYRPELLLPAAGGHAEPEP
ncbi:M15 family metallopeptidase [bacterium]|nr:M15 family metallopeptidase [bacterium]